MEFADCEGSTEEEIKQHSHETYTSAGNVTLRVAVNFYGEKLKKIVAEFRALHKIDSGYMSATRQMLQKSP